MRKLTTNAVAMLLALVGCMGCGNRSASSVDNLIRVDVMADYPEKELILQDLMDVEYIALETTDDFITKGAVKAIGKDIMLVTNRGRNMVLDLFACSAFSASSMSFSWYIFSCSICSF